jgi:phosphate transport system substrate-binding protein
MRRFRFAAVAALVCLHCVAHPARADEVWLADLASARGFVIEAARLYEARTNTKVTVRGSSTIGALEAVAQGRHDLVATARAANPSEASEFDLQYTPVAWDSLAVIVNPKNPVQSLTLEQLRDLLAGKHATWSSLGGGAGAVNLYAVAGPNDGVEWSLRRLMFGRGWVNIASKRWYLNTQQLEDAIALDPNGIGVTLLSNVTGNTRVRPLAIDGVAPSLATMRDGSYPLVTELYLVGRPSGATLARTQQAKAFIRDDAAMQQAMRAKQMLPYRDGLDLAAKRRSRELAIADRLGFTFAAGGPAGVHQPPAPGKATRLNPLRMSKTAPNDRSGAVAIEPGEKQASNPLAGPAARDGGLPCRPAEICQPAASTPAVTATASD